MRSLLVVGSFLTVGCQSWWPGTDGDDNFGELIQGLDLEQGQPISVALWSPEERRAQASYFFLLAENMTMSGEAAKAYPFYASAYNLDPNAFVGAKLIAATVEQGNLVGALPKARRMVLLYPKDAKLRMLYGGLLARTKFYDEAMQELKFAIDEDPKLLEAYVHLASLQNALGNGREAVRTAKQATVSLPGNVASWSLLSRMYLLDKRWREALKAAEKAYKMDRNQPELMLIYAYALELNRRRQEAVNLYEELFRLEPKNEQLLYRVVKLYRGMGRLEDIYERLTRLSQDNLGDTPGVQVQRALILWELEKYPEAARLLLGEVVKYPQHNRLKYMAGLALERVEEFDRAIVMYLAVGPSNFWQHSRFRAATIYRQQKKFDKALEVALQLIAYPYVKWEAFGLAANTYADLGKYRLAVATLKDGVKRFPDKVRLWFMMGVYQERSGDIELCIETMQKVLEKDSENSAAYNYLGYLLAEQGDDLDEAEKLIRRALEIKPDDGYYLDSLGWVYFQRGDYDEALGYFQAAIQLAPGEGVVREHIGDVYHEKDNQCGALQEYRKALELRLGDRDRERVTEKIESIGSDACAVS